MYREKDYPPLVQSYFTHTSGLEVPETQTRLSSVDGLSLRSPGSSCLPFFGPNLFGKDFGRPTGLFPPSRYHEVTRTSRPRSLPLGSSLVRWLVLTKVVLCYLVRLGRWRPGLETVPVFWVWVCPLVLESHSILSTLGLSPGCPRVPFPQERGAGSTGRVFSPRLTSRHDGDAGTVDHPSPNP